MKPVKGILAVALAIALSGILLAVIFQIWNPPKPQPVGGAESVELAEPSNDSDPAPPAIPAVHFSEPNPSSTSSTPSTSPGVSAPVARQFGDSGQPPQQTVPKRTQNVPNLLSATSQPNENEPISSGTNSIRVGASTPLPTTAARANSRTSPPARFVNGGASVVAQVATKEIELDVPDGFRVPAVFFDDTENPAVAAALDAIAIEFYEQVSSAANSGSDPQFAWEKAYQVADRNYRAIVGFQRADEVERLAAMERMASIEASRKAAASAGSDFR